MLYPMYFHKKNVLNFSYLCSTDYIIIFSFLMTKKPKENKHME